MFVLGAVSSRLLKKGLVLTHPPQALSHPLSHPPNPRRAETRLLPMPRACQDRRFSTGTRLFPWQGRKEFRPDRPWLTNTMGGRTHHFSEGGWTDPTAAVERAHSDRARSGSTGLGQPSFFYFDCAVR